MGVSRRTTLQAPLKEGRYLTTGVIDVHTRDGGSSKDGTESFNTGEYQSKVSPDIQRAILTPGSKVENLGATPAKRVQAMTVKIIAPI